MHTQGGGGSRGKCSCTQWGEVGGGAMGETGGDTCIQGGGER